MVSSAVNNLQKEEFRDPFPDGTRKSLTHDTSKFLSVSKWGHLSLNRLSTLSEHNQVVGKPETLFSFSLSLMWVCENCCYTGLS